jgi:hypothetical protein
MARLRVEQNSRSTQEEAALCLFLHYVLVSKFEIKKALDFSSAFFKLTERQPLSNRRGRAALPAHPFSSQASLRSLPRS